MEDKNAEKTDIAKPVPSKPRFNLKLYSELVAGDMNASSSSSAVPTSAIRPKAVRLKSSSNHSAAEIDSSLDGLSAIGDSLEKSCSMISEAFSSTVIYKPTAKLVSKATACLLADLGNIDAGYEETLAEAATYCRNLDQTTHHYQTNFIPSLHQSFGSQLDDNETSEPSSNVFLNMEQDARAQQLANKQDQSAYDGYNWRKYGQKQVKGSQYPRSYYKCTHPSCPVKKKVERSLDGQIAEIVYKGEHNHPKTPPSKRLSSCSHGQTAVSDGSNLCCDPTFQKSDASDGIQYAIHNEVAFPTITSCSGEVPFLRDPYIATSCDSAFRNADLSGANVGEVKLGTSATEAENTWHWNKRRNKGEAGGGKALQGVLDPPSAGQTSIEVNVTSDGYHWRKYGQKVVKGNPNPRSYYRCTSINCNARKHVERSSDNPRSFITTYEGKHSHDISLGNQNSVTTSEPEGTRNKKC